jgi:hypothetical protein
LQQMKGYFSAPGLSPKGEGSAVFFISQKQIDDFKFRGASEKFFEAHSVAEVLKNPTAIFRDLKREGLADGLCYIGKPKRYGDGWEGPTPDGMVFAVYARGDFKVFEWGWEPADKQDGDIPRDALIRYGPKIWKRSQNT